MGKSAAEQIKNTKTVAYLVKKNLELVMALTLTERVHAAKIRMIKLVLISTAVLIIMIIMIKVRTLELLSLKKAYFDIKNSTPFRITFYLFSKLECRVS